MWTGILIFVVFWGDKNNPLDLRISVVLDFMIPVKSFVPSNPFRKVSVFFVRESFFFLTGEEITEKHK